ncbi:MAG: N-acetylmuramoyl-L-alanine amidase [Aliivibrio sp.]|nr:N-acetylmuramoyl-L-alanine amidase [Aliivibrio sp.]
MRSIKKIVVHCSATREGQDISTETIRGWHVNQNGWSDIGYHYVVELDGKVVVGRDVAKVGAHTRGHNSDSIGVCYVGGVESDGKTPKDTRTDSQKLSLLNLITVLKSMYPDAIVYAHRDFSTKACPSFDAKKEYE